MAVMNLTEARINALPLGSGIWRDEQVKGLMVICHASTKTYAVQGDVRRGGRHIRTVRVKIDRCDRMGLREARRRAKELMSQIQSGVDPTSKPRETGMTVAQAYEAHVSERELRPSTSISYREHIDKYLRSVRGRAVADLSRQDVRDLFEQLRSRHGQTTAAGAMRTLRAIINTAMRIDETITSNPMVAIRIPVPKPRQVAEINYAAWWKRSEAMSPVRRDLHRTMMLTGARKTTLLLLERDDVDLERRVLRFRHMKVGGEMLYPMGERLTEIIKARMAADEPLRSDWLWPSPASASGRVVEAKERSSRGVPSPHEYRHLNRTLAIAAGVPYAESALLLGHRLPGASGGYVHREHLVEHLRPHAQAVENLILSRAAVLHASLNDDAVPATTEAA
ncbi:MAG: tyrosine-type recombinase/integrase [Rhizomicrobium sp.]